jgi:hypothetical protein
MITIRPLRGRDPPNVLLADKDASVVNRLCESLLENKRLKAALEEIVGLKCEDVIELVLRVVEEAILVHARHQGLSLENSLGVLLIEREESPSSISDLAEDHLHAPELSLVTQAVFSNQLQLCIKALLLERAARLLERLAICRQKQEASSAHCAWHVYASISSMRSADKAVAREEPPPSEQQHRRLTAPVGTNLRHGDCLAAKRPICCRRARSRVRASSGGRLNLFQEEC